MAIPFPLLAWSVFNVLAVADASGNEQPVHPATGPAAGVSAGVAAAQGRIGDVDDGPVVPAGALGAGAGGEPLPRRGGQPDGQVDGPAGADAGGEPVGLDDGEDEPQAVSGHDLA